MTSAAHERCALACNLVSALCGVSTHSGFERRYGTLRVVKPGLSRFESVRTGIMVSASSMPT